MTIFEEILSKHKRRYDAIDNIHWGCICNDKNCEVIFVIDALHKAQQNEIVALKDLKKELKSFEEDRRKFLAEIAGLENYIKKLEKRTITSLEPVRICYYCGSSDSKIRNKDTKGFVCKNDWHDTKED